MPDGGKQKIHICKDVVVLIEKKIYICSRLCNYKEMELCRECHTENLSHSYMCKYVIGGASVGSIFQKYGRFGVKPTSDAFILPA